MEQPELGLFPGPSECAPGAFHGGPLDRRRKPVPAGGVAFVRWADEDGRVHWYTIRAGRKRVFEYLGAEDVPLDELPPEPGEPPSAAALNNWKPRSMSAVSEVSVDAPEVYYASAGWPVMPLHPIVRGRCGCGQDPCPSSPGKHPVLTG
jgi:hypothetical protein